MGHVERFGSLASDPDVPDQYSDIDLDVFVRAPTTDLDFAKSVRDVLGEVAPIRAARTICTSPSILRSVLLVRDRDCGPWPLARRQFVGYRALPELQLSA